MSTVAVKEQVAGAITLEQARAAVAAAIEESKSIDCKMDIAVVDQGGNLKAFARMDDAWLGSVDIAIKKAKTARFFDMNTGDIGQLSQPGGPLYGIEHSNNGLISFPGGIPIRNKEGQVIGAIGAAGDLPPNPEGEVVREILVGYLDGLESGGNGGGGPG